MVPTGTGRSSEMAELNITLIDVGWGDSILIESKDGANRSFGLVDSNDTTYLQSSYIFIRRFLEKAGVDVSNKPVFDFVMLSHAHSDHGQGLRRIMSEYGTQRFWYPKSTETASLSSLIRYARRSSNVHHHQAIDDTKILPGLGNAAMTVHWPPYNHIEPDENNNSIVLELALNNVSCMLTGDAEAIVWNQIATQIPNSTRVFKVPHHGSVNGTFDGAETPWYTACPGNTVLGISSHVRPFSHPHQQVVNLFNSGTHDYYRTDEHYHVTFSTDGTNVDVKYSHV
jgi:beta-lactamase superfamily II metal-dependent hydrolase